MISQNSIESYKEQDIPEQFHFIGGRKQKSQTGNTVEVFSPRNGKLLTTLASGDVEDINLAVSSAKQAFESGIWSNKSPAERKKVLIRFADLIESHAMEIAVLGVRDNGTEINMALKAEPGSAASTFRYYGEAIDKLYGEIAPTSNSILGLIERSPVGVVGVIVPWNFPLMIGAWKVAPALAAGNSVVLKPSETASLSLLRLAELAVEAGLPEGVFNVVTGKGSVVGEALALHMDVDVLAFTGSGFVGRRLLEYSARSNLKHIYLELGGKSPNIIFPDVADLDKAASAAVNGIFRNSGQVCIAGSRLLVHKSIYEQFLELIIQKTQQMTVGDPLDQSSDIGAINSAVQLQQNLDYVETAKSEGAILCSGGQQILVGSGGYYMQPTIFKDVTAEMQIAQQEVFGPILCVIPFEDEDDAVRIANSTNYGLAAGVWTANLEVAHRMIRKIKSGVIHVNCYGGSDLTVPLGGLKQSGNGHDKSLHAIEKYTCLKSAWINLG
ncbi:MAG: aldehyde dehydrogenase [Gammaproteobacteria bacterium]|nr:aldehyde dehydrogenase [Gammaproteobacteria bacterium]